MNILHVVNISFVIPYFLGNQLKWFSEKGYKEYIICSPSDELEKFSKEYRFDYIKVDVVRKISLWKDLKAIYSTVKYIKETRADVVTGHTPKGSLIAMTAAWFMRTPIRIYFRHGLVYETSKGIKRFMLMNIDRLVSLMSTKVVCVSPSLATKSLQDRLNPEWKQVVLANGSCNGIDLNRFCKKNIDRLELIRLRDKFALKNNDFVIGFTGRLVRDKGIVDLVIAFNSLNKECKNIKLLLVGMFEARDALPELIIREIKENDNIIHVGYIDYSEMELFYALMDVFVLPSYREGFGMSIIEASAMELPVISTRVTGCVDSVVENETGLFVGHKGDEIKDAIVKLYKDESLRASMGRKGKKYAENCFNQTSVWLDIEKLYRS